MLSNHQLASLYICRACFNKQCTLPFYSHELYAYRFQGYCSHCGNYKNIVCKVRWYSKWKLLFAKTPPSPILF